LGVNDWHDIQEDTGVQWKEAGQKQSLSAHLSDLSAERSLALCGWLSSWYAMVDDLRLGGLRSTAASQAWNGWRRNYQSDILLVHGNEQAIRIERDSVHPGRCEASRIGRTSGPIYCLDASAHYPSCGVGNSLPVRFARMYSVGSTALARRYSDGFAVIARCRVRTTRPYAPYRDGDITIWPVGTFNTCLCWPEIQLLL